MINAEQFIQIWQKAKYMDEVIAKTKLTRNAISVRAWWYRKKKGIKLKRLYSKYHGRNKLDVERLKRIARKFG